MQNEATADIVIFGGGIAGLWLLHRLRHMGLSVILLETNALGGGQTNKAQGIIHGGLKYALQGKLTKEAMVMSDMPSIWESCLEGRGEIDLSGVPILSKHQYLWAPNAFAAKFAGFLASTALNGKVQSITKEAYPNVFKHAKFKGDVFALNEIVIDVPALVRELVKTNQDVIYKIDSFNAEALQFDHQNKLKAVQVSMGSMEVTLSAQQFIFTAGVGNEAISTHASLPNIAMQRRPLHMVLAKMPFSQALYAHCIGFGSMPRLTITSHQTNDGETVWYLGGQLAEEGVKRNREQQIKAAQDELQALFPWLDFSQAEFDTFRVDRAEPKQKNGLKPDSSFMHAINNLIIAWPTKLALAPKLAHEVWLHLEKINLHPQVSDLRALRAWPMPPLAQPIWEALFCNVNA